jgi:hypothetical protein
MTMVGCDEWTNPIQTTPAPEKGAMRMSNRSLPVDSAGAACGNGWHHFQGVYGAELPWDGADTVKPYFWTGIGHDGRKMYGVLNNGQVSYGSNLFVCVKD